MLFLRKYDVQVGVNGLIMATVYNITVQIDLGKNSIM